MGQILGVIYWFPKERIEWILDVEDAHGQIVPWEYRKQWKDE